MFNIGIIGGGNGAFAAAAHLGREGHQIKMYSPFKEELNSIEKEGGISLKGCLGDDFVSGIEICERISDVLKNADVVMLIVPTNFHSKYAKLISPLLEDGQLLFLNPGHTGGALEVRQVLRDSSLKVKITLIETNTLTYVTRKTGYNEVTIYKLNDSVIFSALPACETSFISHKIKDLFPKLNMANNILETSLANLNAVMHPPIMILNAAYIERTKGDFYFYFQGTTPAVGKLMEDLDKERIAILESLDLPTTSFSEFFYKTGFTTEEAYDSGSYYRIVKESPPNTKIKSPENLEHRFLEEDISCGLVPMAALGDIYNVNTPVMDALITLSSSINRKNYWEEGRNLKKLGLEGLSHTQIQRYIKDGIIR
jgi:opine dehydrogenase